MTKEEAIKYLWQLYPNGGHCWLDEQRIEAISMAINALQEEPVSEEFEEALAAEWKGYNDRGAATFDALEDNTQELAFAKGFYRGANWKEQKDSIVSEDLEEVAEHLSKIYAGEGSIDPKREGFAFYIGFKNGAKWQRVKDQSTIELAEDHAMLAGMEKMKEEMMANAFDAEVLENYDGKVIKYDETILDKKLSNCKVFDKVKLVIVKKD